MYSMDEFYVMTRILAFVSVILILQIGNVTASSGSHDLSLGGLPSPGNMSNASSTRVSLSNGKLMLDSANADFVYGLFPYNPFNASDPNMGSFRTTFNFTTKTASGALGFIIIDPDLEPTTGSNSSKKKLEDRFVTIISLASRRPQFGDSINASSSSGGGYADVNKSSSPYLCVVINYTTVSSGASTIENVRNIVGEPGLFFFRLQSEFGGGGVQCRSRYPIFHRGGPICSPTTVGKLCTNRHHFYRDIMSSGCRRVWGIMEFTFRT